MDLLFNMAYAMFSLEPTLYVILEYYKEKLGWTEVRLYMSFIHKDHQKECAARINEGVPPEPEGD